MLACNCLTIYYSYLKYSGLNVYNIEKALLSVTEEVDFEEVTVN